MDEDFDPNIDVVAAKRWAAMPTIKGAIKDATSPWLHEEVARRMMERLDFIKLPIKAWTHWLPFKGGLAAHRALMVRHKDAACSVVETPESLMAVRSLLQLPWWKRLLRPNKAISFAVPPELSQDMVWCNMALHMAASPKELIEGWHAALKTDGYVLFSCLGPDTLKELRAAYAKRNWASPLHTLTCLLYTSPSPRDGLLSRMPSSA